MTEILFQKFKERFPPIGDCERITIYEAFERIHLYLIDEAFVDAPSFASQEKINDLASKTFDVNFRWGHAYYSTLSKVPTIIFDPVILPKAEGGTYKLMEYNDYYSGHSIEIELPSYFPKIIISTGNRGRTDLLDRQRDLYYNFVEGVYNLFLENAGNSKVSG